MHVCFFAGANPEFPGFDACTQRKRWVFGETSEVGDSSFGECPRDLGGWEFVRRNACGTEHNLLR